MSDSKHWLVEKRRASGVPNRQPLLVLLEMEFELCNDGFGNAGVAKHCERALLYFDRLFESPQFAECSRFRVEVSRILAIRGIHLDQDVNGFKGQFPVAQGVVCGGRQCPGQVVPDS